MDDSERISAILISLVATGIIVWLISFIAAAMDSGGIFYGKYITKTNPHHCNKPGLFDGDQGDRWQCHQCKTIWVKTGIGWTNEQG